MAMYTALFGKIRLNPEVVSLVRHDDGGRWEFDWVRLRQNRRLRKHPDVVAFLSDERYRTLDRYSSVYFGDFDFDDWIDIPQGIAGGSYIPLLYDTSTQTLSLCTTLINYTGTIGKFLRILPLIATDWELYVLYEEAQYTFAPDQHKAARGACGALYNHTTVGESLHSDFGFSYG